MRAALLRLLEGTACRGWCLLGLLSPWGLCAAWPAPARLDAPWYRHEVVVFGELSFRDNAFYYPGYRPLAGWVEGRLLWGTPDDAQRHRPRPYLRLAWAASNRPEEWANHVITGVGLELRPFTHPWQPDRPEPLLSQVLASSRVYCEALEIRYTRSDPTGGRARYDLRLGAETWREWNLDSAPRGRWAGELYAHVAYYSTRFIWFGPEPYRCPALGLSAWLGPRWSGRWAAHAIPYARLEAGWVARDGGYYWWQGRDLVALGLRVLPLPAARRPMVSQLRLFAEYIHVLGYTAGKALPGTPDKDYRLGLTFTKNRY